MYGFLAGLAICTKQSIGITLAIMVVIYKLIFIKNKKDICQYLKISILRAIGIIIPILALAGYLLLTNSMIDFINYAILGISEFTNKIPYSFLLNNDKKYLVVLALIVPISLFIIPIITLTLAYKNKKSSEYYKILTMYIYSLAIIIIVYPISDEIHFLIGVTIALINLMYLSLVVVEKLYSKIKLGNKKTASNLILNIIIITIGIFILINTVKHYVNYANVDKEHNINHYQGLSISDGIKNKIETVDKYILENSDKKIYILDAEAAVMFAPLDRYNKNYDMFLKGNIGKDGEKKIIDEIKNKEDNTQYLILNSNFSVNWQTPLGIIEYVKDNLKQIGQISIFDIYK